MFNRLQAILRGCGQIFFLPGAVHGALLLAIAMINPRIALAGIVSVLAAYALARLCGMEQTFLHAGYYIYNPLLVGCSIGYRFELGPLMMLLAVLAGMLTLVVTMLTAHLLVTKLRLPILSLPFSLTSAVIYLVVARYAVALPAASPYGVLSDVDFGLPLWLAGFFRSFGAVVFAPSVLVGMLLAALVASTSRVLVALGLLGFLTGALTRGLLGGSLDAAFLAPDNFNFILIAMAIGGMFLTPSLRSCLLAIVATALAPVVLDLFAVAWAPLGVPAFTLPFCAILVFAVLTLRLANFSGLFVGIGKTPEEIRENAILMRLRYPGDLRSLYLPFCGKWTVWQAFNGKWTHQGIWRFAYDFVINDDEGRTHKGSGSQLTDYHCYRMPVLAPVRGRVVRVVDHLPDNPVGTVGGGSNWGNLVILYDLRGFYVEISHFSPKSIRVQEGEWVEVGAALGLCGNSGNSPQPHIHIQVQAVETVGAATLPFSFVSYRQGATFHANDLPPENESLEPLYADKQADERTSFVLDEELNYDVFQHGRPVNHLKMKVKLAVDGTYFFETDRGRLFFGKCDGTFYCYRVEGKDPYLKMLFLASPRLPLAYAKSLRWIDYVPANVALSGARRRLARLGATFFASLARVEVVQTFVDSTRIESVARSPLWRRAKISHLELDAHCGLAAVKSGELELRRAISPDGSPLTPMRGARRSPRRLSPAIAASLLCLVSIVGLAAADRNSAQDQSVREAIQQSVESEKGRDYTKAIETLLKAYAESPSNYTVNVRLGWLYYLAADYASADKCYQAACGCAPKSIEAAGGLALTLLAEGKYPEAEAAAHKMLSLDPGNLYGKLRLAVALRLQQRYKEAADALQPLLTTYPGNANLAYELAVLKATQDPAALALKQLETFDAKTAEAWQASLDAETKGNYADAIEPLKDPYKNHQKSYLFNVRLGCLSNADKNYKDAEAYYEQASKLAPSSLEAKIGHLSALLAQYKFQQAKLLAMQIVHADPLNYYGNLWHAYSLRVLDKSKNAEPILERLTAAYPTDTSALIELALVCAANPQRKGSARDLFLQVLALDPTNTVATQQLQKQ